MRAIVREYGRPDLPEMARAQPQSDYWLAHFKTLAIDEEVIAPISLRVMKAPHGNMETGTRLLDLPVHFDVLLGVDFLKTHRVLIANSQSKFYFTYSGGAANFAKPS